jgi:hypothetical protein
MLTDEGIKLDSTEKTINLLFRALKLAPKVNSDLQYAVQ